MFYVSQGGTMKDSKYLFELNRYIKSFKYIDIGFDFENNFDLVYSKILIDLFTKCSEVHYFVAFFNEYKNVLDYEFIKNNNLDLYDLIKDIEDEIKVDDYIHKIMTYYDLNLNFESKKKYLKSVVEALKKIQQNDFKVDSPARGQLFNTLMYYVEFLFPQNSSSIDYVKHLYININFVFRFYDNVFFPFIEFEETNLLLRVEIEHKFYKKYLNDLVIYDTYQYTMMLFGLIKNINSKKPSVRSLEVEFSLFNTLSQETNGERFYYSANQLIDFLFRKEVKSKKFMQKFVDTYELVIENTRNHLNKLYEHFEAIIEDETYIIDALKYLDFDEKIIEEFLLYCKEIYHYMDDMYNTIDLDYSMEIKNKLMPLLDKYYVMFDRVNSRIRNKINLYDQDLADTLFDFIELYRSYLEIIIDDPLLYETFSEEKHTRYEYYIESLENIDSLDDTEELMNKILKRKLENLVTRKEASLDIEDLALETIINERDSSYFSRLIPIKLDKIEIKNKIDILNRINDNWWKLYLDAVRIWHEFNTSSKKYYDYTHLYITPVKAFESLYATYLNYLIDKHSVLIKENVIFEKNGKKYRLNNNMNHLYKDMAITDMVYIFKNYISKYINNDYEKLNFRYHVENEFRKKRNEFVHGKLIESLNTAHYLLIDINVLMYNVISFVDDKSEFKNISRK